MPRNGTGSRAFFARRAKFHRTFGTRIDSGAPWQFTSQRIESGRTIRCQMHGSRRVDTEDAIELVRLADAIPASAVTAVGLAVVAQRLIEAKQSAAAERLLVRAVRRYPRDYVLNAHLGMLLKAKPNTHAEAIRYLTVARAARPADAVANAQLGAVLADAGRSDEAIDAYRRAYVAWPANDSIRRELARRVAAHGDECSIDYLKMVADDWPADADVLADLGEGQLRHGLFRAATVTLRAATDKLPAESPRRDGLLSAVRTAARLAALEDRIPDLQSGKYTPSSAGGWAQMGDVCARTNAMRPRRGSSDGPRNSTNSFHFPLRN